MTVQNHHNAKTFRLAGGCLGLVQSIHLFGNRNGRRGRFCSRMGSLHALHRRHTTGCWVRRVDPPKELVRTAEVEQHDNRFITQSSTISIANFKITKLIVPTSRNSDYFNDQDVNEQFQRSSSAVYLRIPARVIRFKSYMRSGLPLVSTGRQPPPN